MNLVFSHIFLPVGYGRCSYFGAKTTTENMFSVVVFEYPLFEGCNKSFVCFLWRDTVYNCVRQWGKVVYNVHVVGDSGILLK